MMVRLLRRIGDDVIAAWIDGRRARRAGIGFGVNPYWPATEMHYWWADGWRS